MGSRLVARAEESLEGILISDATAIERVLAECCVFGCPASVLSPEVHLHSRARFAALSERRVVFNLFLDDTAIPFRQFVACSVGFTYHGRAHFFSSLAQNSTLGSAVLPQLMLAYPGAIATVEARESYRVPLFRDTEIQAFLSHGENSWAVHPVDLSMTGILVEFAGTGVPDLPVGTVTSLKLSIDADSCVLRSEVRNRRGDCYGLIFIDVVQSGELRPPEMLFRIVRAAELEWLRRRAN
jgi:hypothetical protein